LKDLPFIFYTATYVDQKDEDFALKLGADRFFRKPLDPKLLLENIRNLLEEIAGNKSQARPAIQGTEKEILKLYSERLVNKLEIKMVSLEKEVAERKRTEEALRTALAEKEVLLREIHHRVKNNMQVISGFLQLQSQYIEDQDSVEKLEECQNRVKTMALVHEKLYQTKYLGYINAREYIESLISDLMNSYVLDTHISMNIDIENVNINLDTAIPCGLILNELITNSIKYAFRDRESGSISVGLHLSQDHFFTLDVRDDGMGLPKNLDIANASTLGLQLVAVLVRQLGGEMHVEGNSGARFYITFPEKF